MQDLLSNETYVHISYMYMFDHFKSESYSAYTCTHRIRMYGRTDGRPVHDIDIEDRDSSRMTLAQLLPITGRSTSRWLKEGGGRKFA